MTVLSGDQPTLPWFPVNAVKPRMFTVRGSGYTAGQCGTAGFGTEAAALKFFACKSAEERPFLKAKTCKNPDVLHSQRLLLTSVKRRVSYST